MKNVSNEYKAIAESLDGSARYYHQILVDGVELTDTIVEFKYSHTCNNSTNFSVGNTASAMVEFKIDEPSINLENKEIEVNQGLKLADGSMEYVKLGKFKVLSPEIERFQASYQCVDAMTYKMATVYESALTYPTTDIAILEEICQQAGIELANTDLVAHTIDKKLDNYTKREIIGFISQLQGKNAIINTDGKLELIWYTQTDYVVDDNRIYSDRTDIIKNENDYVLGYIKSTYGSKEIVSGDINTQGIKITNPYMTQDILDEVFNKIKGLTFRAINVDFYGDFRLEVGDIVTVNTNNESYVVPVMTLEQSSDGGVITTIESIGETATQNSVDTNGGILNEIKRSVVNSETARSIAEQASDKISFVVEGDTASEFTVTENVIRATTEKLIIKTDKGGEVVIENGIMYVDDIFAEEITATGTITGATLYGATGVFEGDVASYGTVTLYTGIINNDGEFIKDAGKIVLQATNRNNPASEDVLEVMLTISSHIDENNKTVLFLDKENKLLLEGGDENGLGGAVIQFGYDADSSMGGTHYYEGGTTLSTKSEFAYKVEPGNTYNYEYVPSPHIERLMADKIAAKQSYLEKITLTDSLYLGTDKYIESDGDAFLKSITLPNNSYLLIKDKDGNGKTAIHLSSDNKYYIASGGMDNTVAIGGSGKTSKMDLYGTAINLNGTTTIDGALSINGNSFIKFNDTTYAQYSLENSLRKGILAINTYGVFGLFDVTNSKWVFYSDTSGNNTINGATTISGALTATSLTAKATTATNVLISATNSKRSGGIVVSNAGFLGLWDFTNDKWTIHSDANDNIFCNGALAVLGDMRTHNVIPATNATSSAGYTVGNANFKYRYIYAFSSSIQTSDRNYKHTINYNMNTLDGVFDALKPCTYYMQGGDRKHMGFIAQDVEEAMLQNGMTTDDLSFVCKDAEYTLKDEEQPDTEENKEYTLDEEGNQKYIYGLKYTELHALEVDQIQKLKTRVSDLEFALSQALARIEMLEEKINK